MIPSPAVKFEKHVFVCVNEKEAGKECCHARGSINLWNAFKNKIAEKKMAGKIRINKAGCLAQCAQGATVVVYPDGTYYGAVTVGDVNEIVEKHLLNNEPVKRLVIG